MPEAARGWTWEEEEWGSLSKKRPMVNGGMLGLPGQGSYLTIMPRQMVVKTLKFFSDGW